MHRCPFLDRWFNRCLKADLASIPSCTKHHSVGSSDKRRMHRCLGIGSSGAPDPKSFQGAALRPAYLLLSLSSLEPKRLRMVILIIILVPLIVLSFDHQNHSK